MGFSGVRVFRVRLLLGELNFRGACLKRVVDNGLEWRGLYVLFVVVDLIEDVESHQSLVLLK